MSRWFPVIVLMALSASVSAMEVPVRFTEGTMHGFLSVRSMTGEQIAQGKALQVAKGEQVETRLVFHFKDGSLYDEKVTFTQQGVFTLQKYNLIQRGPSFPEDLEVTMDRGAGQYTVRTQADKDAPEQVTTGTLELPVDAYNGMMVMILKNLPKGVSETVSYMAFLPAPTVIKLEIWPVDETKITVGEIAKQATQYRMEPKMAGLKLLFGRLFGKIPRDWHYHFVILTEEVPAFVQFEGPLHYKGPVVQIGLLSPYITEPEVTNSSK